MLVTSRRFVSFVVAFGCGFLLIASTAGSATPFAPLIESLASPALGSPSRPVAGLTLTAGHATVQLSSGSAAPVMAGEDMIGLFFVGTGTIEYLTEDPVELAVVASNVKANTGLTAETRGSGLVLRDGFTQLLWLDGGACLEDLPAEGEGSKLATAFEDHLTRFDTVQTAPLSHQLAAWRLDAGDAPFVRAELVGGKKDLMYILDPLERMTETLASIRSSDFRTDATYRTVLSRQPIGRTRRDAAVPRFLLTAVDLEVTAPGGNDLAMTVTETFSGVSGSTSVLLLDLYDTTFGRSFHDRRHLTVKGVFGPDGTPLPFHHAKDRIAVGLPAPLERGAATTVRFEIEGDILHQPGGDSYWALGTAPWFPQPDLGRQYYTVHATLKVAKPFVPLVPGSTVRRVEEGGLNVLETRIDKPVQFMVMLAGKYTFDEETKDGITVRVASYGAANRRAFKKLAGLSQKMIAYYQNFLGPFPFTEFNVIEINDLGWGQAPPGTMFITSEAFNPIGDPINQLFSGGINERFAHEIAHQYWGHVVKMPSLEEQWITESFAEICAGLLIRDLRGESDFKKLTSTWQSRADKVCDRAPIPMANQVFSESDRIETWTTRNFLLYAKGPWMLENIRRQIGDQKFLVFLRSSQATLQWRFGNTATVEQILEAVTQQSWKPLFDSVYWGTAMPAGA